MEKCWEETTIDTWISKRMFDREFILKRLDDRLKQYLPFSQDNEGVIERVFQSECTTGLLTEAVFISLLQTKSTLPCSSEGIQAGKLICDSLLYLGDIPFPSSPGKERDVPRPGLSLKHLTRSLMWMLPDCVGGVIIEGSRSRMRTYADRCRLLFQSLASVSHNMPHDPESALKLAQQGAFEVEYESHLDFCSMNRDDDGDEIYHDLLDVLYSTQEEKAPWLACVHRNSFRPRAKIMAIENDLPKLYSLGIPANNFFTLVKVLLALQFSSEVKANVNQFDAAARSICATFCDFKEAEIITWPGFYRGLKDTMPYLFDPIYSLLFESFLEKTSSFWVMTGLECPNSFGEILTLPRASQLSAFLSGCLAFDYLRCLEYYTPSSLPSPNVLIEAVETSPDDSRVLLLLSGTTRSGEPYVFGVFSPKPKVDGASIVTNIVPSAVGLEPCSIFQLAPVQDIFRGIPDKPGWKVDNETVTFGQNGGVMMTFTDRLRCVEIIHVSEEGGEGVYRSNKLRGNWTVELEMSRIEIWREMEDNDEDDLKS
ncbi:hypothetical protein N7478_003136 [Penicillium angulare]|uniref:uncharacterized protein n=1 Tax=Penicillium angulare TaxID=116970 RepID=UPI002541B5CC|nr:uncharacterized protein N7478_003136 [Penicillium angulare]KAJ5287450.1 hypothetical protein N7478_003136 [Penicillium angulare]